MNEYKKIIGVPLFLIILSSFQAAFLNSILGVNLILLSVLYLIFKKEHRLALIFGWAGGFLIDVFRFSAFGMTSLTILILTFILIALHKKAFFTSKTPSVLLLGILAVVLYRFLEWSLNNAYATYNALEFENFGFYFLNAGILTEIIATIAILLIFKYKTTKNPAKLNA